MKWLSVCWRASRAGSCLPREVPACPPWLGVQVRYLAALASVPRRVSSSPKVGTDLSHLSPPFPTFQSFHSGSKPRRAFIAVQLSSNHLPRSSSQPKVLSLNLFRVDAPRSKAKVIGPTAPGWPRTA